MGSLLLIFDVLTDAPDAQALAGVTFAAQLQQFATVNALYICHSYQASGAWLRMGADAALIYNADAPLCAHQMEAVITAAVAATGADWIAACSPGTLQDAIARAAAVMSMPLIRDVCGVAVGNAGELTVERRIYSGEFIATLQVPPRCAFTIHPPAFSQSVETQLTANITELSVAVPSSRVTVERPAQSADKRPALSQAKVVVAGGNPLKDAATFESLIGTLADCLGGAAGATRAAVDAGVASAELQIGQTGSRIAPQLYIAAGVSGSIQHMAGIRDAQTIIAINTDAQAPIFKHADFGICADLYRILPELIAKLK